jgi:cytochrome c oxidase cbb3-type subunit 3
LASVYLQPPPRNFQSLSIADLKPEEMTAAVRAGRPGTAMPAFSAKLSAAAVDAVVAFIREEFMRKKSLNARYHSAENGWSPAEASEAITFASGEIPIDTPWAALSPEQQRGKRLFLSSCVSCHDIGRVSDSGPAWRPEAVSYPPGGYAHSNPQEDAAPVPYYERHERPPALAGLSSKERRGERLFQTNCVSCHAADGTGRNWVGSFLSPPPPDFGDPRVSGGWSAQQLEQAIRAGSPGTSMPAWRHVLDDNDILALVAYLLRAFYSSTAVESGRDSASGS